MTQKTKVLIIDDDPFYVKIYKNKFEEEGYKVETAYDGSDGIDTAKTFKPDLVLLDLMMPIQDGYEALEQIKKMKHKTHIFIISDLSQEEDIKEITKLGAEEIFSKSNFLFDDIISKAKAILN